MRKYKYDGKEYDFDSYKQGAINDFDSWAQDLNLGKTQTGKIKTAMMELLQHMTDDDKSEATLTRINFGSNYANEKGLFGKNVKDSKHYRNAAAYLLKRFNNSNPYQEAKPAEPSKTKVTRQWIGQQLLDRMGNTTTYTDEQKRNAANKAFLGVSNMLSKTPDAYEFEQGYDLPYFTGLLNNGATAALSNDNFIDDNPYWGELGIANPFIKAPEKPKVDEFDTWFQSNFGNYGISEDKKALLKQFILNSKLSQLGLSEDQIQQFNNNPQVVQPATPKPSKQETAPVNTIATQNIDYNYWKNNESFVKSNIDSFTENNTKWNEIDKNMANLVKLQLQGKAEKYYRPKLVSVTYNNKKYYSIASGNEKQYVYDPQNGEMYVIPKETPKKQEHTMYKKQKGGYLQILKQNNYANIIK